MALAISVTLNGLVQDAFQYTVVLHAGITAADIGKAVAFDGTSPNQVRLVAAGDPVDGILLTVENRIQEGVLVGTIGMKGGFLMTTDGTTVAVGDQVFGGATAGLIATVAPTLESASGGIAIKATSLQARNRVMEKPTSTTAVVLFF